MVAYVPDLMDRSKLAAAAPGVRFVSRPGELDEAAAGADLVVVDLSRPGVLDRLTSLGATRVLGFGSHVDRALLDAARAAGCDRVMARSAFFSRLPELLS
ncbi:MAG: hypothetical protein LC713_02965 [Actinobacteria bacterium]|nr:hypothetical protein [Actinomycetota bacterium]